MISEVLEAQPIAFVGLFLLQMLTQDKTSTKPHEA